MSARSACPAEITGTDWDALADEQFYSSTAWLAHCRLYPGVRIEQLQVRDGRQPAGTCVTAYDSARPGNYDWTAKYTAAGVTPPSAEALLVAPPMGYQGAILRGTALGVAERAPTEQPASTEQPEPIAELVHEIREAAQRMTGQRDCVAMYLPTSDVAALRQAGVTALPLLLEADAWIELPDGGWEGYLAGLSTSRRNTVRRELRGFQAAGCTISHHDLREVYTDLPPLAESMAIKYGYPGRAPDFLVEFGRYVEATGELARVALCRHGDDLIGFCIYYVWGSSIYLRWASFDYAKLTGNAEYFNVSYYSQVQIAAQCGARRLHAGKNALLAKVLRGATLRPMWALELSDRTQLPTEQDQLRTANTATLRRLTDDPILAAAIADQDEWTAFH